VNLKNTQLFESHAPVVLVTGAARRIGAAIALCLHQAGYRVVIHCHQSRAAADQLAAELNQKRPTSALVIQADLLQASEVDGVIEQVIDWSGSLHGLVNNASLFERTDLQNQTFIAMSRGLNTPTSRGLNTSTSRGLSAGSSNAQSPLAPTGKPREFVAGIAVTRFQKLLQVNVLAPWQLSLNARPWLEKTQGCIVNMTDIHAEKPLKQYAEYCQSKAALWMQTKALAREFAPLIRVNAVAPGAIAWPEGDNALSETMKTKLLAETPLKRHGEPRFIAEAVLSLFNNEFMTGQVLRVDGGRSII